MTGVAFPSALTAQFLGGTQTARSEKPAEAPYPFAKPEGGGGTKTANGTPVSDASQEALRALPVDRIDVRTAATEKRGAVEETQGTEFEPAIGNEPEAPGGGPADGTGREAPFATFKTISPPGIRLDISV